MTPHNPQDEIVNPNEFLNIPKWINEDYFTAILEKDVTDFKRIIKCRTIAATAPGENYTSVMVRAIIDIELNDGDTQQISYILKTLLDQSSQGAAYVAAMNLFPKETQMYANYLPKFEELYKNVGLDIKFGPKCLHIDETPERVTLVLEDLKRKNYSNVDRLKGFNMDYMKVVLHKLAEFHAVSAVYREEYGPYEALFHDSFFNETNRPMFAQIYDARREVFQKAMLEWGLEDVDKYIAKSPSMDEYFDENLRINAANPDEFNVLNHGDCWSNNIMLTHDDSGKVQDALFVDFQICKWGSPAQDLWYLITTSVDLAIKVKEFDSFIEIYHQHLVTCLQALGYKKAIPSLRELHIMMLKYGYWGVFTMNSIAPATLFPTDKDANMDAFMKTGPEADAFRFKCFTNPIYVRAIHQLYPFLYNKGLFDIPMKK